MRKVFCFVLITALAATFFSSSVPASAASPNIVRDSQYELMREFQGTLTSAEAALQLKSTADWSQQEIEDYLFSALLAVYYATNVFVEDNRRQPGSWEELRDSGILSPWPGNPLQDWEPIFWDDSNSEFIAGKIQIQLCPPEWYSGVNNPVPKTYVISINGTDSNYMPLHPELLDPYYEWATIPQGTAFITGAFWESAGAVREKKAKKADRDKQPAE